MTDLLVIGIGSEIRGDDIAGRLLAEAVQALGLPGVDVLACHQLTPELAERAAAARCVVFADACPDVDSARLVPVESARSPARIGHAGSPAETLELARALWGRAPEAWLLALPADSFGLGDPPTRRCLAGVEAGVRQILSLAEACPCTR